jgi:hypothetical protein
VSGTVLRVDGNPVQHGTITFNSMVPQSLSSMVVQPIIITATTDTSGNMTTVSLVQGMVLQVYVSDNGRTYPPMIGLVPMASTATFSQIITPA